MYDYLIYGGLVVTGSTIVRADVAVRDGRIEHIAPEIDRSSSAKHFDATGKLVLPGVIDVHSHPVYEDRIGNTSIAAAFGGVTHTIHYAYVKPGQPVIDTLKRFQDEGLADSVVDFSLHAGFFDAPNQIPLIPEMFKMGITSGKLFMTYAKLKWMSDDYWLMAAADILAKEGGLLMVHAENGLATDYLEDKYLKEGKSMMDVFLDTRPDLLEAEAINRATRIAQVAGCPIYIVHNTAALNLDVIRRIRGEGYRMYTETCPQYLCLNDEVYARFGARAKVGPPIRRETDRLALWEGLKDGSIDTIASDHAAKSKQPDDDFFQAPFGAPQVETSLTVCYDEGVNKGRIPVTRLVKVMSENPARIFGLYPQKGTVQVGSDADIVVFDPHLRHKITDETQKTKAGYTLYHGREVLGKPVFSMQRGRELLRDGEIVAKPGCAKFYPTRAGQVDIDALI